MIRPRTPNGSALVMAASSIGGGVALRRGLRRAGHQYSQTTIYNWMRENPLSVPPTKDVISAIAKITGRPVSYFYRREQ